MTVLDEIAAEAKAQGPQRHPDGTGSAVTGPDIFEVRDEYRRILLAATTTKTGPLWTQLVEAALYEAIAEADPAALRQDLIRTAGVLLSWVEDLDRRNPPKPRLRMVDAE